MLPYKIENMGDIYKLCVGEEGVFYTKLYQFLEHYNLEIKIPRKTEFRIIK